MFKNLNEKIDYDYNVFLLLLKALPRTDIISRSVEIAFKMAIYRKFNDSIKSENLKEDSRVANSLISCENSIDEIYLLAKSKGLLSLDNGDIPDVIWNSLMDAVMF